MRSRLGPDLNYGRLIIYVFFSAQMSSENHIYKTIRILNSVLCFISL